MYKKTFFLILVLVLALTTFASVHVSASGFMGRERTEIHVEDDRLLLEEGDYQLVLEALSQLAYDLQVAHAKEHPKESFCFSPASIAPVFGMAILGTSDEEVKAAIFDKMGLDGFPEEKFHLAMARISQTLNFGDQGESLMIRSSNGLFVTELDERFLNRSAVKQSYQNAVRSLYGAEVFEGRLTVAVAEINRWVREHTQNKIPSIVSKDDLKYGEGEEYTGAVLLNALFFSSDWSDTFSDRNTLEDKFINADGSEDWVKVMFASKQRLLMYQGRVEGIPFKILEKRFAAENFREEVSFLIFAPDNPEDIFTFEKLMTPERVEFYRSKMDEHRVNFYLPKFELEEQVDLLSAMEKAGYHWGAVENFDKMIDPVLVGPSELSKFLHRTRLKVDEYGAEGAAATAAIINFMATSVNPMAKEEILVFDARKPFLFRVNAGDLSLFAGSIKSADSLVR